MTTETKYLDVEFIVTIPIKIEVESDISNSHLKDIARREAMREMERIEQDTDGLLNWLTFSGTVEPMSEIDIELYEGLANTL